MTVLPFAPRRRNARAAPTAAPWQDPPVRGTFRAPSGQTGTMTGSLRLERFVFASGRLWAEGVFTGTLWDADGSQIATGSRRQAAPAVIAEEPQGRAAVVGPVEVDLLGLLVSIPAFRMHPAESLTAVTTDPAAGDGRVHHEERS